MNLHISDDALPLSLRLAVPLTDEELMLLSEENRPYKIERTAEGEISVMTPVGGIGSTYEVYIASVLFQWAESNDRGMGFGSNAGFNLPDGSCLAPDAAWLSLPRWQALTPEQQAGYPPLCPEFVIEIRSRSDSRRLLETKMQLWLSNGAELGWLVDPVEGSVSIYEPGAEPSLLQRPEAVVGTGPVAGFVLRTTRLWATTS